MPKEKLIEEEKRLRDLYYSTKQQSNHTSDVYIIIDIWKRADYYWSEADKIVNQIRKLADTI